MNKIKDEQLERIQNQQTELNNILHEVGYLETTQHGLMHKFATINEEVEKYRNELFKEYGDIDINIQTGEYTQKVNENSQLEVNPELNKVD